MPGVGPAQRAQGRDGDEQVADLQRAQGEHGGSPVVRHAAPVPAVRPSDPARFAGLRAIGARCALPCRRTIDGAALRRAMRPPHAGTSPPDRPDARRRRRPRRSRWPRTSSRPRRPADHAGAIGGSEAEFARGRITLPPGAFGLRAVIGSEHRPRSRRRRSAVRLIGRVDRARAVADELPDDHSRADRRGGSPAAQRPELTDGVRRTLMMPAAPCASSTRCAGRSAELNVVAENRRARYYPARSPRLSD